MDIFIFDDHDMMRKGIGVCFSDSSMYNVVGEAGNIVKAKSIILDYEQKSEVPAVAIIDVGFSSGVDCFEKTLGFELVEFIKGQAKNINCVMYSSYSGQAFIRNAISKGALGYVSKTSDSRVLVEAVNTVVSGKTFIDPYLCSILVTTDNVYEILSKREKELLSFIQKNYSNEQISAELNITVRTIENHLSSIYSKTGAKNRNELLEMFGRL